MNNGDTLVDIKNIEMHFSISGDFLDQIKFRGGKFIREQKFVHAINDVSLTVKKGEALCVVGESGCGKLSLIHI